jgi:hypothetical protein
LIVFEFQYLSILAAKGHSKVGHGPQDGHERLDGVGVDHRPVLLEVLGGEAALVNDPDEEKGGEG